MIAHWMAYSVAISCLLGVAGLALERACRLRRLPTRWIWAALLVTPFLLPFAVALHDSSAARDRTAPVMAELAQAAPASNTIVRENGADPTRQAAHRIQRLAASPGVASLLLMLWIGGSVLLALGLLESWLRLRQKFASWPARIIDGTEVLVSEDIGPAVIGFLQPRIVVPAWLLMADAHVRRLTLAHEGEHVQAHDPLLLLLGTIAVVLLPWNLPLWWQWRRLRFAIEVDCDARVLASGRVADLEYAEALLNVAERSAGVPLAAAAMCESPSTLEKRIGLFLRERSVRQHVVLAALLIAGMSAAAAATQIDAPAAVAPRSPQEAVDGALGRQLVETINQGVHDSAVAMVDAGADVNRVVLGDGTPLIAAVRHGDVSLAKLLLERGARVDLDVRGDGSPLIAASTLGNLGLVSTLVEHGADVNGFVLGDETPLINAARAGHLDVVRYLVANGADVNLAVPADEGARAEIRSPLGEALKYGNTSVVNYLRAQGAGR
jgi:beta-lactamase regulating signal transducer with metallopeptidase domain